MSLMLKFWQQLTSYCQRNKRHLLILFITALVIRLIYFCTHLSFTQDQVRDVLLIKEHLVSFNFYIPLGPAAASYSNFNVLPFYYYLQLAAHLFFGNTFYSMNILTILLESCSTVMMYYLLSRTGLKKKLSFLGSLLYALTPATISLVDTAWNPSFAPFFTIILLISGLWYLLDNRHYGLIIHLLTMVIFTGFHFQWFVLLPLVLVVIGKAVWRLKDTWKSLLIALAASLVIMSPYLYSEVTTNFQNLHGSLEFLTNGPTNFERISKPDYLIYFFPNFYNRVFFDQYFVYSWTWLYEINTGIEFKLILNSLCFWSIFVFNVWQAFCQRRRRSGKWLGSTILIFISMTIFLRFYKGDKPDYFLNVFIPFIFVWLTQVLNCFHLEKVQIGLVVSIVLVGHFILWRQPIYNQYHDYQTIVNKIKDADSERQIVILNQEIEGPIRYFLPDENYVSTPSAVVKNIIFVCYASQECASYRPNINSKDNIFQYNFLSPLNYGITYEHYDSYKSGGWFTKTLEGFLVVNDLP